MPHTCTRRHLQICGWICGRIHPPTITSASSRTRLAIVGVNIYSVSVRFASSTINTRPSRAHVVVGERGRIVGASTSDRCTIFVFIAGRPKPAHTHATRKQDERRHIPGVNKITAAAIAAHMSTMTNSAIPMPRQLRCCGVPATNSCNTISVYYALINVSVRYLTWYDKI
jgi:hypothetical protein